jgi:hypothetical protein
VVAQRRDVSAVSADHQRELSQGFSALIGRPGLFRPELNAALSYTDRTEGGRPPFDPVLMFKILVIQATNNLSDERAKFLINDRLSFMRFLGLGLEDRVPDARTIRLFREKLDGSINELIFSVTEIRGHQLLI